MKDVKTLLGHVTKKEFNQRSLQRSVQTVEKIPCKISKKKPQADLDQSGVVVSADK